ncbi:hypothetical protein [uncultured Duncaniella sp.]|uniref:hypothetical protein n=1 Tax=uncultured Duncaniella sp. TaxID=2768039 RepID=UPI0025FC8AD1|nr:hypothetical protein [uncultured Duncaniella sp.]
MLITIYDRSGNLKAEVSPSDSSTQVKEIQGDNVLTLSFTHHEHIALDVDDYCDYEGERYWLTEAYRPEQKSTLEWVYDIKLYGIESMIKNILVLKRVDGENDPVFTLTAPPREHVAMIVNCMNDGAGHITDWKVGQVDGTENIVIDYHGKYCDEALREIAEKVGAEWWVEGQTVNVCRCQHGEQIILGYDKGLTGITPDKADNVKFYTRLFPVGSSRNIDPEKYGYTRLQLPGGEKYVEVNADKYGRVDHYEDTAFSDIYPRRTGEVSSVRSEVKTSEDGKPFTIYYFRDNNLPFDPNDYEIGGLVKRVSFQEGSELGGLGNEDNGTYYFEVNFNSDTKEFEIITIWPYEDDTQLPGGSLVPKAGDKYILWNIRMPDKYYALAEEELLSAVNKYNEEHAIDVTVFKCPTDHVWIEDNDADLFVGRRVRLESEQYFPETGYRDSRITKITRKVNLPSSMDIEIGDALSRTSMQKMSDSISDARSYAKAIGESVGLPDIIRTGDKTLPTDNNLFSARRSQKEFISKNSPDRARRKIIFDEGIDAGDFIAGVQGGTIDGKGNAELLSIVVRLLLSSPKFVDGLNGEGWRIWLENELSHLTVDRLTVRQVMTVFELLIEKIRSVGGQICVSAANGKIKEVKTDGDSYVITFEQGNSFMAGDLMRCATFKGGTTEGYWVEIAGADPDSVRVRADEFAGAEPKPGDECVLMGSATDAGRQSFILISATEDGQPRMDVMDGVAGKSLVGCLRARVGNLDGITDNGFPADNQPHGHGLYSDNAYLRGTFLLSTGEDIKTKFEIVEGKITSAVDGVRRDIFMEKGYLGNSNFAVGMEKWETSGGILHYTFGSTWLWVGTGILATRKPGVEVARDGDRTALRIENDYILQRNADMRNRPEPMVNAGGEKLAVPVYLSVFYRCVKAGRLTVRFENVDKTGFENFNSMETECDLDASEEYNQLTMEGLWNGSGDFLLKFSGEIYICMIVLSTDKAEALTYRHRTLFEQSEKIVKIAAQNFDRDGNVLEESGILTTARMAGLYAIDGDGRLKSFVGAGQDGVKIKSDSIELEGLVTANSNFRILEDGSVEANKGTFKNVVINGSIRSPFARETDCLDFSDQEWDTVTQSEGDTETRTKATHDNVVPIGVASGWTTAGHLEWDTGQSGRRMVIANYRWENEISSGWVEYAAPEGMYFFEDGVGKESLRVSRECVELIGYGTETTFYGWIVLKRTDLMTASCYGRGLKSLATGRVSGSQSGAAITYRTFDGAKMEVARTGEGRYRVTVPKEWKLRKDEYMVILTGFGTIAGGTNPIKATLMAAEPESFEVLTSDDETANDGSFMFAVTNLNDWI